MYFKKLGRFDLKEGIPRPGLRPVNIEDLTLEREDIGLQEPVIIIVYPSPSQMEGEVG